MKSGYQLAQQDKKDKNTGLAYFALKAKEEREKNTPKAEGMISEK